MAHEELKALYEIDKQHSDTPWEFWQHRKLYQVWCDCLPSGPEWDDGSQYRRKPDAPVWPDDKEDARKWRELESYCKGSAVGDAVKKFMDFIYPKPTLIQDYTEEQWQTIIDGKFLCEFSDIEGFGYKPLIQTLREIDPFRSGSCLTWKYCRPLRTKGVRQPWFGDEECPVNDNAYIHVKYKTGLNSTGRAADMNWPRVVEFIEL